MQPGHAGLVRRSFALLANFLFDLLFRLGHNLFDARRVDASVLDQLGQRQSRDFPTHWVEARKRDRVRCVVNDQVDPSDRFQRTNVATLAANDATLHLLIGNRHHRGGDLANGIARVALNRH